MNWTKVCEILGIILNVVALLSMFAVVGLLLVVLAYKLGLW